MSKALPIRDIVRISPVKVTPKQIHKWIQRGLGLIHRRLNGRIYIRPDDFHRFLKERSFEN